LVNQNLIIFFFLAFVDDRYNINIYPTFGIIGALWKGEVEISHHHNSSPSYHHCTLHSGSLKQTTSMTASTFSSTLTSTSATLYFCLFHSDNIPIYQCRRERNSSFFLEIDSKLMWERKWCLTQCRSFCDNKDRRKNSRKVL
jgi:hypothetical protein